MRVRRYRLSAVCQPATASRLTLLEPSKLFEKVVARDRIELSTLRFSV
jgi:hypothetical protein